MDDDEVKARVQSKHHPTTITNTTTTTIIMSVPRSETPHRRGQVSSGLVASLWPSLLGLFEV